MKPQELEAIPQPFEAKMRELQQRIMEDIVRRLRKNAGEVTAATEWQMKRAYELGVSKQALRQLLEQVAVELETQVDEVYDSRLANVYSADRQRYKADGKPFIEYAENKELQQLISAVKAQTKDEFRNITQSMGFALPSGEGGKIEFHPIAEYYQQTLDGAVMDIASGAFDYNTVLKRITNEMTNSGVRTVAYASGHTDRIEVAARRAVMTGFHQVVAKKAEQDMAALDTNYVEVTWHHGARPTHQVWQGKVYFWDRGFEDSLAEPPETLDNSGKSGIIDLEDIPIGRSVGAKAKNYDIMDLQTGESFKFAEGTKLQNVQVFAGKGSKTVFRKAQKYADKYGGEAKDWQHVKGFGVIDFYGEDRKAEVHWVQCENIGKLDFFIKEWLE